MTEQPYDAGHARGASCARGCEIRSTLSESATFTLIISAKPSGHPGVDQDRRPLCRQVLKRSDKRKRPLIAAYLVRSDYGILPMVNEGR